jgi:hypothetical protein
MKARLLILLVTFLVYRNANAQTTAIWCLPGATWEYSYFDMSSRGVLTVRYANDTIVGGQVAQVLRRTLRGAIQIPVPMPLPPVELPLIITRVVGNDVSFWYNGQFVPLYRFGAQPGSSWTTYATHPYGVCPQYPVQVVVDSVGQRTVNGRVLRWQAVHSIGNVANWRGRIYEGIGSLISLQPYGGGCPNTDPGYIYPLLSFRATGFPAVGGPGLTVLATADARAEQAGFLAYPNPTTGSLIVQVPATMRVGFLRLHDLAGRLIRQQPVPVSGQVTLGGLSPGTYLLNVESANGAVLSRRVVVQ